MPAKSQSSSAESLSGSIERVTFFNEENGFAILKVKAQGQRDLVTVLGALPSVAAGEYVHAEGRWIRDKEFGLQFKAETINSAAPTTSEGIERYLGSGMVKGIGPIYARKLVQKFGDKIFQIIDDCSARLEEVEGIGPGRRKKIKAAWAEQKIVRAIMVFLHSQGVGTSRAVRIYKTYGEDAISIVRSNPYKLAQDIPGIGFKTADQIARNVGIPTDSLARATAGLNHVLLDATSDGHCALPAERLCDAAVELLQVGRELVVQALQRAVETNQVEAEQIDGREFIFLPHLRRAEEAIARRIKTLASTQPCYPAIDLDKAIQWCQTKTGRTLAPSQQAALREVFSHRMVIITGGPGVGKTTLVNAILLILRAKKVQCLLCAPTGRAARRLTETTGLEARTVHRLLEGQGGSTRFQRNESNPLDCELLVVDECSMVDLPLMHQLLRALPPRGNLILVGDVDQLPSVGPGSLLADLIGSGRVPVVRLTEVFRQAAQSLIISAAHRINRGQMPELTTTNDSADFYFIERAEPEHITATLLEVIRRRAPARFQVDPVRDIQVLCPMNRGTLGVRELNVRLQKELNPLQGDEPTVEKFGTHFRPRDKVMQTTNNYDKDVFNGDIGQVTHIDPMERELTVRFEEREVTYEFGELDELVLAYAITIHKSQGSEFPVVIIPLAMQHYVLLQRNLIYTGVTRGRRLVILIGQPAALAKAVRNNKTEERCSGLLSRLQSA